MFAALRAKDLEGASDRFVELLGEHPDEVLPRDAQLTVANHWFAMGKHTLAAQAYETFLAKYPDDRERHDTALMLALVCARYLNDPVRAGTLLTGLDPASLSEGNRSLADTLRHEIG